MASEPVSAKKYLARWNFRLNLAKRFLTHTFPDDNDFVCSIWADWGQRIQAGHDADAVRIQELVERCGDGDSAEDVGDWIAEDVYNMKDLTNAMYAALVVSAWARMETFLKLVVRASNVALEITADNSRDGFGKIKEFFEKKLNVNLSELAEFKTVTAIRILNNSFKHNDGSYRPDSAKSHTQIDDALLNRWQIIDSGNRIEFSKLSIKELIVACNSFGSIFLTRVEAAILSNLRGLGYGE